MTVDAASLTDMRTHLSLLALLACSGTEPGDSGDDTGPAETGTEQIIVSCEVPSDLAAPSLTETSVLDVKELGLGGPIHMLELVRQDDAFFAVGTGGVYSFRDVGGSLQLLDRDNPPQREFHRVAAVSESVIAVSHRERGLGLYDVDAAGKLTPRTGVGLEGASGMVTDGDLLYALRHTGGLHTYDISSGSLAQVHVLEGLGNPWSIVLGEDIAYIADNDAMVHIVDLSDRRAPVLLASVDTGGGAQDLTLDGGYLHVAVGSSGIETFAVDGQGLTPVGSLSLGEPVIGVDASEGVLWATNHANVAVLDARDGLPVPVGSLPTPQWAMHPVADGTEAWVADWETVRTYSAQLEPAPIADLSQQALYFFEGSATVEVTLSNRGGAPLEVAAAEVADPRFTVSVADSVVAPGEETPVTITFVDDGEPIDSSLCLVTNDPTTPLQSLSVSATNTGSAIGIGEVALDFTLTDLDGTSHTLSQQLGNPVVLAYFATW